MKIFIDMDHTLNKLYESYNLYYKKLFDIELNLERNDLTNYFLHEIIGTDIELEKLKKFKIFNTPGFWESIPIYENAANVMKKICQKHDVFIVTAPWISNIKCYEEKRLWIEKHLPFFDVSKIIFTKYKHLLQGDIIIDDCPENIINSECQWKIKMSYPYNKNAKGIDAVTWFDIEKYINNIDTIE